MMFAVVTLIVTAPVFYFITQWIYIGDTNETLQLSKKEFEKYSRPHLHISDIEIWNKMNWNIKIDKFRPEIKHDTIVYLQISDSLENESQPYRVLQCPVIIDGQPYTLFVRMNMIETEDLIESIVFVFLGICLLLVTGLYFITRRLSLRMWKPFYQSLAQIEHFEIDKTKKPFWPETYIEEFSRLNQSVDKLINRNIEIYNSQQEFIENAAHELQTPLAVFRTKLDELMQTENISREQVEIIELLIRSVSRLNRLNKNLLLLSKIDHDHYSESESLMLNEVIQKQCEFFSEQAKSKNILFHTNLVYPIRINTNSILIDTLISNLLLNAVKYSKENGVIDVLLTDKKLTITNSGPQIALDAEKIFHRFSKINPSSQGNGLGLAIVKKIAELYDWNIIYKWENNLHVFEVMF